MRPCRRISWALPSIEISQLTCLIPSLPGPNYRCRTCWVDASSVLGKLKLTDVLIQFHANYPFSCFVMGKIICSFCSWFLGPARCGSSSAAPAGAAPNGVLHCSSSSTALGEPKPFLDVLPRSHKTWLHLLLRLGSACWRSPPKHLMPATFLYFLGRSESENKYTKRSFHYMPISQHMMRNQKGNSWFVLLHEFYLACWRVHMPWKLIICFSVVQV